ncbi:bardet-biedl syndromet [Carpediemonas membranifera]|uniref:Bardet-biedl syndromet n=1 Tax=Carpediemonas membranifera TaxID=201153 RepID=A0A8J6BDJ9_9EUKA|nr:bardet-biedl syndromet [Carpediemonas membranifera]|eukprot:KAG9395262.1 bardet-biedl syndromet [Carpediemonas membranifera]
MTPFLDAFYDPIENLDAISSCIESADLYGDGDHRLLIASRNRTLRVYRGAKVVAEHEILGTPSGVVSFRLEGVDKSRSLAIAIAAGTAIFVYKPVKGALKPHSKFCLPPFQPTEQEQDIWRRLVGGGLTMLEGCQELVDLRNSGSSISPQSESMLTAPQHATDTTTMFDAVPDGQTLDNSRRGIVTAHPDGIARSVPVITAITVLPATINEHEPLGQIIVATEGGDVYLLGPSCRETDIHYKLKSVPIRLHVTGTRAVAFRVTVPCRDRAIYSITEQGISANVIRAEADIVDVVRIRNKIFVATADSTLSVYSARGRQEAQYKTAAPIVAIEHFDAASVEGFLLCLASGEVRMFRGAEPIATMQLANPVKGIRMVPFARESHCLVSVTDTGALDIKILHRSADLGSMGSIVESDPQDVPLGIIDDTTALRSAYTREKDLEAASKMYFGFQTDLLQLKLAALSTRVKARKQTEDTMAGIKPQVGLRTTIEGFGPSFLVRVHVSARKPLRGLSLCTVCHGPDGMATTRPPLAIKDPLLPISVLLPGIDTVLEVRVAVGSGDGVVGMLVFTVSDRAGKVLGRSELLTPEIDEFVAQM